MSKFRSRDRSRDTGVCARSISRIFLYNIFRRIQLNVLHHIFTGYELGVEIQVT